jgi:RNA polymerase-binding transcription factor DksA
MFFLARGLLFSGAEARSPMRTDDKTRKRIELELARVNWAVQMLKKEPRAEELEGFGDNTPLSEEMDAMIASENSELRSALLSRYLDRAAALDEAKNRLDAGTYGVCITCGQKISPKRLSALPEALHCTRCQEEAEKLRHPEIHAHEWKRAEETFQERDQAEAPERTAITGAGK